MPNGTGTEPPADLEAITTWEDLTPNGNNDAAMTGVAYNLSEKALQVDTTDGIVFTGALGAGAKSIFSVAPKKSRWRHVYGRAYYTATTRKLSLSGHWDASRRW